MRTPTALRSLDDKVLARFRGRRNGELPSEGLADEQDRTVSTRVVERGPSGPPPSTGDGARQALSIVYRISRLVFLLLAVVVVLGIIFVLAPTNPDNDVVSLVTDVSDAAAGPFRDVFTVSDNRDREVVVNYGFAAAVYVLAAALIGRLPTGKG